MIYVECDSQSMQGGEDPCEGVRELQDKVAGFEPIVKAARALCEFYRHKGWSSVGEESELIAALMETTK